MLRGWYTLIQHVTLDFPILTKKLRCLCGSLSTNFWLLKVNIISKFANAESRSEFGTQVDCF